MSRKIVPVSTLISYIRQKMDNDPVLRGVMIEGEVSNMRKPYTGHWYFSLKDEKAQIPCVMFASSNRRVSFPVNNGDKVIVKGDVSVYESEGRMQMLIHEMKASGIGELYMRLEMLKKKLAQEHLFDAEHKKKVRPYPESIALVTGNNTAAREDALVTLRNRWPVAKVTEYTCPVQGTAAAPKIIEALLQADAGGHDVILLVRGGGSIEELWCFNDEALARCIYDLQTPIITGIGHEIDFTLAEYTADYRSNTPTGAAMAAVPDIHEVRRYLEDCRIRLVTDARKTMEVRNAQLMRLKQYSVFTRPERLYADRMIHLQYMQEKLLRQEKNISGKRQGLTDLTAQFHAQIRRISRDLSRQLQSCDTKLRLSVSGEMQTGRARLSADSDSLVRICTDYMQKQKNALAEDIRLLDAYSPLKILERGYSITTYDSHALTSVDEIETGQTAEIRLSDGKLTASVLAKEKFNG